MTFNPRYSLQNILSPEFDIPEEEALFRDWLAFRERTTADLLNIKENGNYEESEFLTGQSWFTAGNNQEKRSTFRKVFNRGSLSAGSTDTFAHGLANITAFTRLYGTCVTDTPDFRPIPYVNTSALNQQISLRATDVNIIVTAGSGGPDITSYIIVVEALKN